MAHGRSPLGPPLLNTYGGAGLHSTATYDIDLIVFVVVFLVGAWAVLSVSVDRP